MTSVGFCSKTHKRKRLSQHRKRIESAFTETKLESGDEQRSIPVFFLDSILCRLLELMLAQLATSPQLFFLRYLHLKRVTRRFTKISEL